MDSTEGSRLPGIEILNQRRVLAQPIAGSVPSDDLFPVACPFVEGEHRPMVFHIDLHFVVGLEMWDGEATADLDHTAVVAADAEEGADDAVLVFVATEEMVQDGEENYWVDVALLGGGGGRVGGASADYAAGQGWQIEIEHFYFFF